MIRQSIFIVYVILVCLVTRVISIISSAHQIIEVRSISMHQMPYSKIFGLDKFPEVVLLYYTNFLLKKKFKKIKAET